MTVEKKEWISALADGELEGMELHRTIDRLRSDCELLDSWQYHHLIRDAIHSNLHQGVDIDLHLRVASALEREPTVLAPQRRQRTWLKQAAGVAIAASVTGVAILGIRTANEAPAAPATVAASSGEYVRMQPVLTAQNAEKPSPQTDELAPYLVNHNEYSVSSGMHGMLPYVRIVGYKVGH